MRNFNGDLARSGKKAMCKSPRRREDAVQPRWLHDRVDSIVNGIVRSLIYCDGRRGLFCRFAAGGPHDQFVEASLKIRQQVAKRRVKAVLLCWITSGHVGSDCKGDRATGRRARKRLDLLPQPRQSNIRGRCRETLDLHQRRRLRNEPEVDADRKGIARLVGNPGGNPQRAADVVHERLMIHALGALLLRKENHKRRHSLGRSLRRRRRQIADAALRAVHRAI